MKRAAYALAVGLAAFAAWRLWQTQAAAPPANAAGQLEANRRADQAAIASTMGAAGLVQPALPTYDFQSLAVVIAGTKAAPDWWQS
jgi:hypothetical protein